MIRSRQKRSRRVIIWYTRQEFEFAAPVSVVFGGSAIADGVMI